MKKNNMFFSLNLGSKNLVYDKFQSIYYLIIYFKKKKKKKKKIGGENILLSN